MLWCVVLLYKQFPTNWQVYIFEARLKSLVTTLKPRNLKVGRLHKGKRQCN